MNRATLKNLPGTEPDVSYGYDNLGRLTSASGGVTLTYDPTMRLQQITGAATTKFAYDGLDTIAEYDGAGTMLARYVFGPGIDQPLERYDGSGTGNKVSLHADERGSITALSYGSPYAPTINRYDEYGKPQSTNSGRFQYTGQRWLSEAGLYDYKARDYLPHLGIFAQSDPIGYELSSATGSGVGADDRPDQPGKPEDVASDRLHNEGQNPINNMGIRVPGQRPSGDAVSPNLYVYVLDDPVNLTDSSGQCSVLGKNISEGIYDFGSSLTDKASLVIAGGLIFKSPQAVLGGEIAAVTGTVFQAIGAEGRLLSTGNVTRARYDAIGIVFSFFQSQTRAGSLAMGYTGGKAVEYRTRLTPGHDCG